MGITLQFAAVYPARKKPPPKITHGHAEPRTTKKIQSHALRGIEEARRRFIFINPVAITYPGKLQTPISLLCRVCVCAWRKKMKKTQHTQEIPPSRSVRRYCLGGVDYGYMLETPGFFF